jgi:hypothetical protein
VICSGRRTPEAPVPQCRKRRDQIAAGNHFFGVFSGEGKRDEIGTWNNHRKACRSAVWQKIKVIVVDICR